MTVCRFFQQGNCRNGDNCRFEHPGARSTGFSNQNRFAPLGNRDGNAGEVTGAVIKDNSWNINPMDVKNDLTEGSGRPKWILSTYGPGKNAPASLLEGNEYSPEEIRLRFYEQAAKGNEVRADQEAIQLWTNCEQAIRNIAENSDNVIKFMELSEKKRPNRYDLCRTDAKTPIDMFTQSLQSRNTSSTAASSGFGAGTGFGQAAAASNPFSKPTATNFGQQASNSGFGSSSFGQTSQPSAFGGSTAFGKPAFGSTGFGQTSTFGQTATPTPGFGQTSQPQSTFGQPAQASTFGASSFGTSGFGQAAAKNPFAAPSAAGGFGQASVPGPFAAPSASSAFGQAVANNPFAAPSAASGFGQASQTAPSFGQSSQTTSTFGQPQPVPGFGQAQASSGFGQQSAPATMFGQSSQASTPFGQNTRGKSPLSGQVGFGQGGGFGKPAFGQPSQAVTDTFGQSIQPQGSTFGQPTPSGSSAPAFGSASAPTSSFTQPSNTDSSSPFGVTPSASSTAFGQDTQKASPFGQAAQGPTNPFAKAATAPPAGPAPTIPAAKATNASPGEPHTLTQKPPHPLHYTESLSDALSKVDVSNKLTSYRGLRVQYINNNPCYERPDRKGWERIWFPNGAAEKDVVALNNPEKVDEIQGKPEDYKDGVKEEYKYLFENGNFRNGKMPLVPPMREWCLYDF